MAPVARPTALRHSAARCKLRSNRHWPDLERKDRHSMRKFLRTPKGTLSAIFAVLLAIAGTATGWSVVGPHLLVAILGACGVEVLAAMLMRKKLTWPTSALLSGAIVAMILTPTTPLIETLWIAGLATASKYLITTARGHIFNP